MFVIDGLGSTADTLHFRGENLFVGDAVLSILNIPNVVYVYVQDDVLGVRYRQNENPDLPTPEEIAARCLKAIGPDDVTFKVAGYGMKQQEKTSIQDAIRRALQVVQKPERLLRVPIAKGLVPVYFPS